MKFGLAHGGGVTRGFARLGVAQALHEIEVPIDCAWGSSRALGPYRESLPFGIITD